MRGCPGVVSVDNYNLYKLVKQFTMLIKFDRPHPYGPSQQVFMNVSSRIAKHAKKRDDILVGHVGIWDEENVRIATVYGANDEAAWPVYKVFHRSGHVSDYEGDALDAEALAFFFQKEAGLRLELPGMIAEMDDLCARYARGNYDVKQLALHEADVLAKRLVDENKDIEPTVRNYIKVLHKIATSPKSWLENEIERVEKLMKSDKVSVEKRARFLDRLKVLHAFTIPQPHPHGRAAHMAEL